MRNFSWDKAALWLGVFNLFLLLLHLLYSNSENLTQTLNAKIKSTDNTKNFYSEKLLGYRICINEQYPKIKDNKQLFMLEFTRCIEQYVNINKTNFESFDMGRFGEKKYFLPMSKDFPKSQCKWLTIGIGGDTMVERLFKEKYPDAMVYGVEPSPSQFVDFAKYGTVIPHGVGIEESTIPLIIRDENNAYTNKNVTVFPLHKLLDRFLKTRVVHYMTIDIEGFEYTILKELLPGKIFGNENVVFCQIDAELHEKIISDEDVVVNLQHFLKIFTGYPSPYLPVFTTPFLSHEKVTFINIESEECEKAFNFKQYL